MGGAKFERLVRLVDGWRDFALRSNNAEVGLVPSVEIQEVSLASRLREDYAGAPQLLELEREMLEILRQLAKTRAPQQQGLRSKLEDLGKLRGETRFELTRGGAELDRVVSRSKGLRLRVVLGYDARLPAWWRLIATLATFSETDAPIAQVLIA